MKYCFYLIFFLGCIFLSSCNEAISFCDMNSASETIFKMRSQSYAISYSVNESLMQRYINLTAPNKEVEGITPIIRNTNDTLAYIVQYLQGWEIVSGDIRMTPRLAYAETGEFSMSDYLGNGAGGIEGMLDLVDEKKRSNDTEINQMWDFIKPNYEINDEDSGITLYGDVAGMWVPIDTTYIDNGDYVPHIIPTRWHQMSPYNNVCPYYYVMIGGTLHRTMCYAGCGPIAFAQVINNYLKNSNPYNVAIPTTHTRDSMGYPQFGNFSSTQWQYLDTIDNSLATFIAYLGKDVMDADFEHYATFLRYDSFTAVDTAGCREALDWAHLLYDQNDNYNWQNIVTSIQSNRPVLALAYNAADTTNGHAFIIDALRIRDSKVCITYEWDDDYTPDYWELQRNPAWMFDVSVAPDWKGDGAIYQEEIILEDEYSVAMNWGYVSVACNNIFYTLRVGSTSLTPSWRVGDNTYDTVRKIYYNIRQ